MHARDASGQLTGEHLFCAKLFCSWFVVFSKVAKHHAQLLDCWYDDGEWNPRTIAAMWSKVWSDGISSRATNISDAIAASTGKIKWQTLYNKLYEAGLLKEIQVKGDYVDEHIDDDDANAGEADGVGEEDAVEVIV